MTRAEAKRLAREARGLASDICEGRAPPLDPFDYCGCAIGEVLRRAGHPVRAGDPSWDEAVALDGVLREPDSWWAGLVSIGLRDHGPNGAVVPLLALADELEQPRAAPSSPPDPSTEIR